MRGNVHMIKQEIRQARKMRQESCGGQNCLSNALCLCRNKQAHNHCLHPARVNSNTHVPQRWLQASRGQRQELGTMNSEQNDCHLRMRI